MTAKELLSVPSNGIEKWARVLAMLGLVSSAAEAERIMKQRGFEVDGEIISDPSTRINLNLQAARTVRIGKKKFARIVIE